MSHPIHHYNKRKRIHKKHEKYPHPDPLRKTVDRLIYVFGLAAPLLALPQVYKIFSEQNATSMSLLTFSSHIVTNFFWINIFYD